VLKCALLPTRKIPILFVTTEPEDLARPQTTRELEVIKAGLSPAFRIANVYRANRVTIMKGLKEHKPEVVHFLCHGRKEGLMIEDRDGVATLVSEAWLISVFARCPSVRLVVLNACRSAGLAQALVDSAETRILGAVGWSDLVDSDDAREFAGIFHARVADRESVSRAFSWARDGSGERPAKQAALALREEKDFYVDPGPSRGLKVAVAGALLGLVGGGAWCVGTSGTPDTVGTPDTSSEAKQPSTTMPDESATAGDSGGGSTGNGATTVRIVEPKEPGAVTDTGGPSPTPLTPIKRPIKVLPAPATSDGPQEADPTGPTLGPPPAPAACEIPSTLQPKLQSLAHAAELSSGSSKKFRVTLEPGASVPTVSPRPGQAERAAKQLHEQLQGLSAADLGNCVGRSIDIVFNLKETTVKLQP
jgi:hypothetical protein